MKKKDRSYSSVEKGWMDGWTACETYHFDTPALVQIPFSSIFN
jgi:hypothetical protein